MGPGVALARLNCERGRGEDGPRMHAAPAHPLHDERAPVVHLPEGRSLETEGRGAVLQDELEDRRLLERVVPHAVATGGHGDDAEIAAPDVHALRDIVHQRQVCSRFGLEIWPPAVWVVVVGHLEPRRLRPTPRGRQDGERGDDGEKRSYQSRRGRFSPGSGHTVAPALPGQREWSLKVTYAPPPSGIAETFFT